MCSPSLLLQLRLLLLLCSPCLLLGLLLLLFRIARVVGLGPLLLQLLLLGSFLCRVPVLEEIHDGTATCVRARVSACSGRRPPTASFSFLFPFFFLVGVSTGLSFLRGSLFLVPDNQDCD